jgi:hypothetical protein
MPDTKALIGKARKLLGLPCAECGGKGYVIDSDVADFIVHNGLAKYQAATTLMNNEDLYGELGSLPVCAWDELGLTEDQSNRFVCDVAHVHVLHACRSCNRLPNHPDALGAAKTILNRWIKERDRHRADWRARRTPEMRRREMRERMASAIRYEKDRKQTFAAMVGEL